MSARQKPDRDTSEPEWDADSLTRIRRACIERGQIKPDPSKPEEKRWAEEAKR